MNAFIRPALTILAPFTLLTGFAYPLLVTAMSQIVFPDQANGSLLFKNGKSVGSSLIGQNFTDPKYFWGRLSATGAFPYNAMASGGSNYGAMHPALAQAARDRVTALRTADTSAGKIVPVDLATASGSGLDPHITLAAAQYQARRVANARLMPVDKVLALISAGTEGKFLGFPGMPYVNVLKLNLALDAGINR